MLSHFKTGGTVQPPPQSDYFGLIYSPKKSGDLKLDLDRVPRGARISSEGTVTKIVGYGSMRFSNGRFRFGSVGKLK